MAKRVCRLQLPFYWLTRVVAIQDPGNFLHHNWVHLGYLFQPRWRCIAIFCSTISYTAFCIICFILCLRYSRGLNLCCGGVASRGRGITRDFCSVRVLPLLQQILCMATLFNMRRYTKAEQCRLLSVHQHFLPFFLCLRLASASALLATLTSPLSPQSTGHHRDTTNCSCRICFAMAWHLLNRYLFLNPDWQTNASSTIVIGKLKPTGVRGFADKSCI